MYGGESEATTQFILNQGVAEAMTNVPRYGVETWISGLPGATDNPILQNLSHNYRCTHPHVCLLIYPVTHHKYYLFVDMNCPHKQQQQQQQQQNLCVVKDCGVKRI
jgi:hypothetical protein